MTWPHGLLPILFQRIIKSPRQTTFSSRRLGSVPTHPWRERSRFYQIVRQLKQNKSHPPKGTRGHTTFSSLQSLPPTLLFDVPRAQPPYDPVYHVVASLGLWVHPTKNGYQSHLSSVFGHLQQPRKGISPSPTRWRGGNWKQFTLTS